MMSNCYEKKHIEYVSLGDLWNKWEGFSAWLSCCDDSIANVIKGSSVARDPHCSGSWLKHSLSFKALREILV